MDCALIPEKTRKEILRRLKLIEREYAVQVIYACESGSRAWGFPSPDSDFDVRFLYIHERDWYLSFDVERRRDVIEQPIVDEIDCSGWDLRKALYLFTRTNGALHEWLHSPIQYLENGTTAETLRQLAAESADLVALCFHYSHMARSNARGYLFKEDVRLKKYFYVLRPLLAIRYIEAGFGVPPVEFRRLVGAVAPVSLKVHIEGLLALKRETSELGTGNPIPELDRFIKAELSRHEVVFKGEGRPGLKEKACVQDKLNELFRSAVLGWCSD